LHLNVKRSASSAGVETKTLQEKYLESGSLDTPLEKHSGLLDHRKLVDF
jgi:hypothetical protein